MGSLSEKHEKSNGEKQRRYSYDKKEHKDHKPQKHEIALTESTSSEYTEENASLLDRIPGHEMDLIHFIVGHGILRREMR